MVSLCLFMIVYSFHKFAENKRQDKKNKEKVASNDKIKATTR